MAAAIEQALAAFLATGITGALCIILMGVVIFLYRARNADVKEQSEAHEETRKTHLADLRAVSTLTNELKIQMASTEATIRRLLETYRGGNG